MKSATGGSIITWIKFPEQNFLGTANGQILLIVLLMVALWPKLQMEIVD